MKRLACSLLFLICMCGCASQRIPTSFSQVSAPGWITIEVREDVDYDRAWKTTLGILVRDFDIEFTDKDYGYIRTAWTYTWSGIYQQDYRVRVTAKFADDHKSLQIKSEAQSLDKDHWVIGVDTRQLSTLKTDLMGTIGRTAR